MAYVRIQYEKMKTFSNAVFQKMGFTPDEAAIITDVLLTSDMYGIESHGVQRMVLYYKTIKNGRIHMDAKWEIVHETPLSAVIDNHFGVGQLVAHFAMNKAIEKAKKSGIGIVTVRNSNHYGIAGYYAKMACKEGLIGFSVTNSEAIMVPTYGRMAMLGSNPIAIAMPAEPYDFFFDASTTVVTRGKVEVYNKNPPGVHMQNDKNRRKSGESDRFCAFAGNTAWKTAPEALDKRGGGPVSYKS